MAMMSEDVGWQRRLCAKLCAPPVAKLHITRWPPRAAVELARFQKGILCCMFLGFARGYCNNAGLLNDFMGGGTDFFSGLLGMLALYDCCAMNGSFMAMFIIWASVNAVLFDVVFSLGMHLADVPTYTSGPPNRRIFFWSDNGLIIISACLQLWLCRLAHMMLSEAIPNWLGALAGTSTATGSAQPLLGEPQRSGFGSHAPQPQVMSANSGFRAFGGSGQRLGASGGGAGSQGSRLLQGNAVLPQ